MSAAIAIAPTGIDGVCRPDIDALMDGRKGIRVPELAKEIGVSPGTLYARVYAERVKVWRIGKAIIIPADQVGLLFD